MTSGEMIPHVLSVRAGGAQIYDEDGVVVAGCLARNVLACEIARRYNTQPRLLTVLRKIVEAFDNGVYIRSPESLFNALYGYPVSEARQLFDEVANAAPPGQPPPANEETAPSSLADEELREFAELGRRDGTALKVTVGRVSLDPRNLARDHVALKEAVRDFLAVLDGDRGGKPGTLPRLRELVRDPKPGASTGGA